MGLFKGKKDASGGDEDGNRSALFGSRSKNDKSSTPASQNPYANLPTQGDAYSAAKARAGVPGYAQHGPPGGSAGGDRYGGGAQPPPSGRGGYGGPPPGQNRYGAPPPNEKDRYGAQPPPPAQGRSGYPDDKKGGNGGYGADKYGAQGGYGADRYGSSGRGGGGGGGPNPPSKYGAGGYGGLGGAPAAADADDGRDALFGGAKDRVQKRTDQQMGYGAPPPTYEEGGNDEFNTGRDPNDSQSEAYGDRQLTAEEEEEEDVTATKQQMRFIKQEDVSSTRNALRIAAQAEESGMNTLARIGAQGERIHHAEKNLDLTSNQNRMAEAKAKELKTLNRSMFAVHVSNPFTAGSRAEKRDNDVMDRHHLEREQREATRRQGYETNQRMEKTFKDLNGKPMSASDKKQASLAERAKFQFEADSEDDEMENEIDSNLDALGGAAARLNGLARATGKEVDEQNRHLERINQKSSRVDDEIAMNRARLDRFK